VMKTFRYFFLRNVILLYLPFSTVTALRQIARTTWKCQRSCHKLSSTGRAATDTGSSSSFDLKLAVILAGYSFEAYNEPSVGKVAYGLDGTHITFTSSEYIRRLFSGALVVNLRRGEVRGKQDELAERIISGEDPDPYVVMSVLEAPSTPRTRSRIIDSAQSKYKGNTKKPQWDESFYMYVADPDTATLAFRALDREIFREDQLIGVGAVAVAELREQSELHANEAGFLGVPIPLYIEDTAAGKGLINLPFPKKKVKSAFLIIMTTHRSINISLWLISPCLYFFCL
jgi:C2 domain